MRDLSNTKWMVASCGALCLAAILATGAKVSANSAGPPEGGSQASAGARAVSTPSSPTAAGDAANRMKEYGRLPLAFERSSPESKSGAAYVARGDGYTLFLASREADLLLRGKSDTSALVRMELAGANAGPQFTALEELPGKSNYFIGNDPAKWRTNVAQYRKVLEHDVYRGVDLVYYGTQGRLEYDFDVAPGTDPGVIQLAFTGAGSARIDGQGELVVATAAGEVRMRKPVAYQEVAGSRRPVVVGYAMKNGSATFEVASYDTRLPLVIDPILSYSTYLGGSNIDGSNAIAVAPDNTAFIAGLTFSSDFPVVHALQPDEGGGPDFSLDAFVAKISTDGSTLLYSTYLGGENRDFANGIAVDNFGEAYVTGLTLSPHFPVTIGSVNTLCGGDGECGAKWTGGPIVSNAFVSKLNAAGSGLIYSTFLGEFENVNGLAIAVDADGIAYVTGETEENFTPAVAIVPPAVGPPPFPITASAFQPVFGGGTWNAFLTKIDATGAAVLYSSYYGGSTEDIPYGIAVDGAANAYITGLTYSTDLRTTAGVLQTAYGGAGDGFVAKVNTNGTGLASLVYSTYIGGAGLDQGSGIAIDSTGAAYITGVTDSASFGSFTPAGFQTANAGEGDAFVAKLTPAGAFSYFTYLGGSLADAGTGIALDSSNNVYITGTTVSQNFPTAGAVFQPTYGGGNADSFVAKLGPTGSTLLYSSYLGGTNTELATGIAVDTAGNAYVTGQTCSQDFPLANPLQAAPGGNCDAYVAKVSILPGFAFNPAGLVFAAQSLSTTSQPEVITLTNGENAQTISNVAITGQNAGDFAETNTCPATIAVGATCAISVTFTPTAAGIRKAAVTIIDSAPGSPHVLNLSGNTSTVTLSAASLSFGQQPVGTASPIQSVEVTNTGTTPLTIKSVTASGDFVEANNCTTASLYPGTTCLIQVEFLPSAAVASTGAITLTDSAVGSPQVILATGTGVLVPQATVSPTNLTFASQNVQTISATQNVLLANTGNVPLTISGITATGDFGQTNNCGTSLAIGASCTITVTFTPTAGGVRKGLITIADNATPPTQAVSLTGTGATFQISSTSSSNAAVPAGQTATIPVTISASTGFTQAVTLSCSMPSGIGTCAIAPQTVSPTAAAAQTATLTVTTMVRNLAPPVTGLKNNPFSGLQHMTTPWLVWLLMILAVLALAAIRQRPLSASFGFAMVLLMASVACGGAGTAQAPGAASGTPAGTYQVIVTGTSGAVTSSMPFTLQVN